MTEKLRLFTIGQFAALHGIHKKTLMWYDEVGLFHPAVTGKNGYRYYTYFQSATLEAILLLRELDVPIARIRAFLENRSLQTLDTLLDEQMTALDQKLSHLKEVRAILKNQKEDTKSLIALDVGQIRIVRQQPERLLLMPTGKDVSWEQDVRTLLAELHSRNLGNLYNAGYGAMIAAEKLYTGDVTNYHAVFLRLPAKRGRQGGHCKPGGLYLVAYYQGDVDHVCERYPALLAYAERHGLIFQGNAYETVCSELAASSPEVCITRIEIPLAEKAEPPVAMGRDLC